MKPSDPATARPAPDADVLRLLRDLTDGLAEGLEAADVAATLVQGCLEHTAASEAGLLVADPAGGLQMLAFSSERMQGLELFELEAKEGPCVDAYRTAAPVTSHDLRAERTRWPRFTAAALDGGIRGAHSMPLRLRDRTIGALNLFVADGDGPLGPNEMVLVEILAGAAALGILTRRHIDESDELAGQLQHALDSRVAIEQAKGIVAARTGLDMARAFEVLRRQARHERRSLRAVAEDFIAESHRG